MIHSVWRSAPSVVEQAARARPQPLSALLTLPVPVDADSDALERATRQEAARLLRRRLPDYLRARRGDLEARIKDPALSRAADSWGYPDGNLFLLGHSGLGKSSAAAILFQILIARGVSRGGEAWALIDGAQWARAVELELAFRAHAAGRGEHPFIVACERATVLFLDDFGLDRDVRTIQNLLAYRRQRKTGRTIFTSGLSLEELEAHYGAAALRWALEIDGKPPVVVDCLPPRP